MLRKTLFRSTLLVAMAALPLGCSGGDGDGPPIIDVENPRATNLVLAPSSLSFEALGDTLRLSATVKDQFGATMSGQSILWVSNDVTVATVSSSGLVTSVGDGSAKVRALAGLARDTVDVDVSQTPHTIVALAGDGQFHWTGFVLRDTLVVEVKDKVGTPVAGAEVRWGEEFLDGGVLALSAASDADGRVKAFWQLATGGSGNQRLSAHVSGIPPAFFQAMGYAPITVLNPELLVKTMLDTLDVTLFALDSMGVPERGIAVEVLDLTGFGEIVQGPTTTDVNGFLVTEWILGPTPGVQTLIMVREDIGRLLAVEAEGTGTLDPWPFTNVSTGEDHTCGILPDGTGHCWGEGDNSQLGTGDVESASAPVLVSSLLSWQQLASGRDHTCALTSGGGALHCWGDGFQTGQGADVTVPTPLPIPGGPWAAVTSGQQHSCAIAVGGAGFCWGEEAEGRLGNGVLLDTGTPTLISGGRLWSEISAGRLHTCGVATDGRGYCWGQGSQGQLGSGGTDSLTAPVEVAGGWRWKTISAGWEHSCGVVTTGEALCWGDGSRNQLGSGSTADQTSPVIVSGDLQWSTVAAGRFHSCGIDTGKNLYCWGRPGALGIGDAGSATPAAVLPGLEWEGVYTQARHTCARTSDGETYCWGFNTDGQLGIGNMTDFNIPRLLVRSVF